MAVKLTTKRRFSWPVYVHRPKEGEFSIQQFTAHFEALTRDELNQIAAGEIDPERVLRDKLQGWEGVTDEQDQPVPCEGEALDQALEDVDVFRGLLNALMEASSGEAGRKNSRKPRAN